MLLVGRRNTNGVIFGYTGLNLYAIYEIIQQSRNQSQDLEQSYS
jgi:hypothetical protein